MPRRRASGAGTWLPMRRPWTRPGAVTSSSTRVRAASIRLAGHCRFILTADNRWVWILQRGRVVARNADGTPERVIGICLDIDRRKREETASKANESRLATALWGARAAFWQWHLPTDIRTMSP